MVKRKRSSWLLYQVCAEHGIGSLWQPVSGTEWFLINLGEQPAYIVLFILHTVLFLIMKSLNSLPELEGSFNVETSTN